MWQGSKAGTERPALQGSACIGINVHLFFFSEQGSQIAFIRQLENCTSYIYTNVKIHKDVELTTSLAWQQLETLSSNKQSLGSNGRTAKLCVDSIC